MAQVKDIVKIGGGWDFGWTAGPKEFEYVLAALKQRVPVEARAYNPETHRWWVALAYVRELPRLFSNWESAVDEYESQMSLF
jgi:hypothetical protein